MFAFKVELLCLTNVKKFLSMEKFTIQIKSILRLLEIVIYYYYLLYYLNFLKKDWIAN